ncbi:hypothetical protein FRB94_006192 [Tulasnella sp. JGI-2019a]|nr:hypothetical protein FRB93_006645 [Tulasnella sp. JGI-2019a]KAG8999412.1 hypothetical protein FRB94_006192 [Tulasnella sp. JGI-2019a]KAG9030415.1 hypothetical protein FRB95_003973 [Tulasnella sp. JGI-2019a]
MVLVNDQKFACANCIQGHRSSSCGHTDRPLYEIKKKGRPVSQCERCRERRKIRKLHVKCICDDKPETQAPVPWPTGRKTAPRRIPSVPTFPNGIKDIIYEGLQVEVPMGSKRHRATGRSSQQPEAQSSDGSTSSSSFSSPTMSPQSSWDSSLPSLHLPKTSYFPSPSSMPPFYAPHTSSPGSSYPTTPTSEPPQSRNSPSDTGSYFGSYTTAGSSGHNRFEQQQPLRQAVPPRGSFTKDLIARSAASIPPPPSLTHQSRTCGGPTSSFTLNSTNTVVYSSTALRNKAAGFSVGLVSLSPLDAATCCGGRCSDDCGNTGSYGSGRSRNGVSSG